jgi:hypothetical protein
VYSPTKRWPQSSGKSWAVVLATRWSCSGRRPAAAHNYGTSCTPARGGYMRPATRAIRLGDCWRGHRYTARAAFRCAPLLHAAPPACRWTSARRRRRAPAPSSSRRPAARPRFTAAPNGYIYVDAPLCANGARCAVADVVAHCHRRQVGGERHTSAVRRPWAPSITPSVPRITSRPPLSLPSYTSSCGTPTIIEVGSATLWSVSRRSAACEPWIDRVLLSAA